jgi:uncharacterized membrane protein
MYFIWTSRTPVCIRVFGRLRIFGFRVYVWYICVIAGVTYVKYSKTSEAARAMEAMNGKCIGNLNRSIRVMIAAR